MSRRGGVVAIVLAVALLVSSCSSRDTAGPAGDAFYTPPADLSGYSQGELIWAREFSGPMELDHATNSIILYAHTGVNATNVATSAFVAVPKGTPPAGGWPVVAWGHGTHGLADQCAPTRFSKKRAAIESIDLTSGLLQGWLDRGYAVVASDYEGLGTPGVHPYLIGLSEGRSVLQAIRAAREFDDSLSNDVVLAGHSQGGHAALWAASMAGDITSDLNVEGVVAYAPPTHFAFSVQAVLDGSIKLPVATVAIMTKGLEVGHPGEIPIKELLSPQAQKLYPQTATKCVPELNEKDSFGGLPLTSFANPGSDPDIIRRKLNVNDPTFPLIRMPILVVQGGQDKAIPPILTNTLVKEYRAKNYNVTYLEDPEADHMSILARTDDQVAAWVDQLG